MNKFDYYFEFHQMRLDDPTFREQYDAHEFEILSVGSVANDNLYNLGHLNLKANGNTVADLPGDVSIAVAPLPEVSIGTKIEIRRRS